ncbi:MAG: hypothetical protein JF615_05180 [Asticcacaulis sp.]|nr:hypothetical protein [Asticcacaulis sp.]
MVLMVPSLAGARPAAVESADLTLKTAAAKSNYIIDGAEWTCSNTACHAAWVDDMPAVRSCQRVVAEIGAVDAFTWRGKVLSADDLARCNASARA